MRKYRTGWSFSSYFQAGCECDSCVAQSKLYVDTKTAATKVGMSEFWGQKDIFTTSQMDDDEQFQTRSETLGLDFFKSFEDAYIYAKKNPCVWKISFLGQRWLKVTKCQGSDSEYSHCAAYKQSRPGSLLWVNSPLLLRQEDVGPFKILTDEEFKASHI